MNNQTLPDKNKPPDTSGLIRAGNNRYIKPTKDGLIFFSYSMPVIVIQNNRVYKTSEFFSITTSRHITEFLKSINCDNPETLDRSIFNSLAE